MKRYIKPEVNFEVKIKDIITASVVNAVSARDASLAGSQSMGVVDWSSENGATVDFNTIVY